MSRASHVSIKRLVLTGHSHAAALSRALWDAPVPPAFVHRSPGRVDVALMAAGGVIVGSSAEGAKRVPCDWEREPEHFVDRLQRIVERANAIALLWKGNQQNARALVACGPRFDVVLPGQPDSPAADVEIIPCSAVESFVRRTLEEDPILARTVEISHSCDVRALFLAPPPPLPEQAVRSRLAHERFFVDLAEQQGASLETVELVEARVRRKLWMILVSIYERYAAEHGLEFVQPPRAALDDDGLLASAYWGRDVTHANVAYGCLYLDAVAERAFGTAA